MCPGRQRLPLTIGPRYSRPDEADTPGAQGQPLGVWRDPGHRFALDLVVHAAATITSPSHALEVLAEPVQVGDGRGLADPAQPRAGSGSSEPAQPVRLADESGLPGLVQRVRLRDGSVLPDRDLVLVWRPQQAPDRPALGVLVHEEPGEGTRYFLALVSPPAVADALPVVDREITLLVDRSGSMAGPKWQACRWAVRRFLAGLRPTDTFHLGLFQSTCDWLAPAGLPGTDANRERALSFLDTHAPGGGTELGPALEQAMRRPHLPGQRALRFRGTPLVEDGLMPLLEGVAGQDLGLWLTRLHARLEGGDPEVLTGNLTLCVWIDDPSRPVVRVPLREVLALGGERPLNLALSPGWRVGLLLRAPEGTWPAAAGVLVVELS